MITQLLMIQIHGLKAVHPCRFGCEEQVEYLARVMRRWDEDGIVDGNASRLGEFIIKVFTSGLASSSCLSTDSWLISRLVCFLMPNIQQTNRIGVT